MTPMPPSVTKLLLIDINVLGFGAMREWAYRDLSFEGKATGAIQGTLDKVLAVTAEWPAHVPVVLWDDRCHWREQILPTYKRHRWTTAEQLALLESYLSQAAVVRELLGCLGVPQIFCPGFEADDLAGVIARGCEPDWEIVLATSDTDWLQALRENVIWHSPATGMHVRLADLADPDKVRGGPFLSTDHYVKAKALAGDTSDGIPGFEGVGLKTAAKFLREQGSMEALWARYDAGVPIKGAVLQRAARSSGREMYYRNLRLIDWRLAPPLAPGHELSFGPADRDAFRDLCAAWGVTRRRADETIPAVGAIAEAAVAAIGALLADAARGRDSGAGPEAAAGMASTVLPR